MAKDEVKVRITGDTSDLNRAANDADQTLGKLGGKFEGFAGKIGPMMATAGAAIGASFVAAGAGLVMVGDQFDGAYDKIRVGTGATGAELDKLKDNFRNVVASVPADFESASTAVTTLASNLDLTGKPLDDLSAQMLELSRITDTDLGSNLESTTALLKNWSITGEDSTKAMDLLFRASQQAGVPIASLSGTLSANGEVLRALGMDYESSAALVATLAKSGVEAGDVFPALSKAMAVAAKDGKSAGKVLDETFASIKNAPNDTAAAGAALEVFGAKAGPKMAQLIREGKLSYDDMLASINNGGDTIIGAGKDTQDFAEKWEMFKNKALLAIEPIATRVFGLVGDGLDWVTTKIGPFVEGISKIGNAISDILGGNNASAGVEIGKLFGLEEDSPTVDRIIKAFETIGDIWDSFTGLFSQGVSDVGDKSSWLGSTISKLGGMFSSVFGAIAAVIERVVIIGTALWEKFGDIITRKALQAFNGLKQAFSGLIDMVTGVFDLVKAIFTGKWGDAWDAVKKILGGALDVLLGLLKGAWAQISGLFEAGGRVIGEAWNSVWQGIQDFFGGVWDWIVGKWDDLVDFVQAIPSRIAAVGALMWTVFKRSISDLWQNVQDRWNSIVGFVQSIPGRIAETGRTLWNAIVFGVAVMRQYVIDRWNEIIGFVTGLPGRVSAAATGLWNSITFGVSVAKSWIVDRWNEMVGFVTGLPSRISSAASGMWDGIKDAFRSALNWIIGKWNGLSFTIPAIDIPGFGKIGGNTFSTPDIARFHTGGTVPGFPGQEVGAVLLAGETVRTSAQEAAVQAALRGNATSGAGMTVNLTLNLSGSATKADADMVMAAVEEGLRRGIPAPRLKALAR